MVLSRNADSKAEVDFSALTECGIAYGRGLGSIDSMELGLSSWAFPWALGLPGHEQPSAPMAVFDLLQLTHARSLRRLQLADNIGIIDWAETDVRALRAEADRLAIRLEYGERGLTLERTERALAYAVILGSPFLRMVIDSKGDEPCTAEIVHRIDQLLPRFRERGVVLALENHDRFTAAEFAALVSREPRWLAVCLDTANSLGAGEGIDEVLHHLAPYTINLHCKDITVRRLSHGLGFLVEGCAAGMGQIPFDRLVRRLRETGRCQSAVLEQWSSPRATLEETMQAEAAVVQVGLTYLRTLLPS